MGHEELKVSKSILLELATYIQDNFVDTGEGDWTYIFGEDYPIYTNEQVVDQFMEKFGYNKS